MKNTHAFQHACRLLRDVGHGHVIKNCRLARCGGPAICGHCQMEQELLAFAVALDESVTLQSHYGELLNMHDGGKRMTFGNSGEWMARLVEVGKLEPTDGITSAGTGNT